jgi:hypothetical protein
MKWLVPIWLAGPSFGRPASGVFCDSAAERRYVVAMGVSPWNAVD